VTEREDSPVHRLQVVLAWLILSVCGCARSEPQVIPADRTITLEEYNQMSEEDKQNPAIISRLEKPPPRPMQ